MGFFREIKNRARFNHIERKKNRIITRQNIVMKIHSLPGEIHSSFNLWKYNFTNDIREIGKFKGTLRLGIWISMILIVVAWAFFYGKIQAPILDKVIDYSLAGGAYWDSLTKEIGAKLTFLPGLDETLRSLATPFLGHTLIGWITAVFSFVCKFIIWCVPAIFLVRHYAKQGKIRSFGRMMRRPFSLRHCWGSAVVIFGWIAVSVASSFINKGAIYLDDKFNPIQLVTTVLSVAICEEILLRGWFLNALNTRGGPVYSSVIISFFYMLLLLPRWIPQNLFSHFIPLIITLLVTFTFTFCLCIAYNRSRSIWTSFVLRLLWALSSVLLPGSFF